MSKKTDPLRLSALQALLVLASVWLLAANPAQAQPAPAIPLNDTGQSQCYSGTAWEACTAANSGPTGTIPGQDGRYGRDAASSVAGQLTKTGGGSGGFDFSRICMNGEAAGVGSCPATPTAAADQASPAATDWACTQDNVTNLVWSLQSGAGDWTTYATVTLPGLHNAANAGVGRCGGTGWRLPTRRELLSIVHFDRISPPIDTAWFPGTVTDRYWSSDTYAGDSSHAWYVSFSLGNSYNGDNKGITHQVRLVRGGH